MDNLYISGIFDPDDLGAVIVPESYSLEDVVRELVRTPALKGVFLVDEQQRFAGVVTRADLLKWAYLQLDSDAGPDELQLSLGDLVRLLFSTKAKDIARGDWRRLGVRLDDELQTAIKQMLHYDVIDIPVLNHDGHILGDLKFTQVLLKALEAAGPEEEV